MGMVYQPTYRTKSGEQKKSAIWWLKYYQDGMSIQESSGTKKYTDAMTLLKQREGKAASGEPIIRRMNRIKFDELAKAVVRDYERNGKDTVSDVKTRLSLNILPYFGKRLALSITTETIQKYIDVRLTQKTRTGNRPANGTINRELAIIKRAFNLAMKARQITTAPYIPMLIENNVRRGFYEEGLFEEAKRLVGIDKNGKARLTEAHADVVRDYVTFNSMTGWRSSESKGLLWADVDFTAGRIYLADSKNGEARYFPITDDLRVVLDSRKAYTKTCNRNLEKVIPFVFHRDGEQLKACERSWKSACVKAGMGDRIMHDFRRTAVRSFRRAGLSDKVAMKLTGHKTRSVYDRYNIVDEKDLDNAADLLNTASKSTTVTVSVTVGQKTVDSELPEAVNS